MAYNVIVKAEAFADTLEAYSYYEDKSNGLGERFMQALQDKYDQILQNPELYSFIDKRKKLRDIKLEGFPYLVVYGIEGLDIIVYVIHNSYKKVNH